MFPDRFVKGNSARNVNPQTSTARYTAKPRRNLQPDRTYRTKIRGVTCRYVTRALFFDLAIIQRNVAGVTRSGALQSRWREQNAGVV